MNILAFDTCLDACSAAVFSDSAGGVTACAFEPMITGQAERLVPMIGEVMGESGLTYSEIDRIAVTVGPGTFTGTRIGVAAARALALAMNAEVVSATSLSVIAQRATSHPLPASGAKAIGVAVDARRGQIYWQRFGGAGGVDALCEPQLLTPEQAAQDCGAVAHVIVGSGAEAVGVEDPGKHVILPAIVLPHAADLADLAARTRPSGPPKPLYLRSADAKPQIGKTIERTST